MKDFDISNKFYKVALHLSPSGFETWWDSKDTSLPPREIELLKTGLGKTAMKNINDDFFGNFQDLIKKIFNPSNVEEFITTNVKNSGKDLKIIFSNPVVVEGKLIQIDIEVMIDNLVLDKSIFKGSYLDETTTSQDKYLAVYGMLDADDNINPIFNIFDLLYSEKIGVYIGILNKNPFHTLCVTIANKIKSSIINDMRFMTKVLGLNEPKVSSRYGFTFERSPLMKKLIEYIDSGNEGDRLDFLIDSGTITVSKDDEGNPKFLNRKGGQISSKGYMSSFFASAVLAKIIGYKRVGRKKIMVKGPNFEVFKKKYFD